MAIANCYLMTKTPLNGNAKVPKHESRRGKGQVEVEPSVGDPKVRGGQPPPDRLRRKLKGTDRSANFRPTLRPITR